MEKKRRKSPGKAQGYVNIRVHVRSRDILAAIAAARGMSLIDLLDVIASSYDPLVKPLRDMNGHIFQPTNAQKITVTTDA